MAKEFKMSEKIGSIYVIPLLKYRGPIPSVKAYSPNLIIDTVSRHFGLESDQVRKRSRKRELVLARFISMYFMRQMTRMTLIRIGEELGGFDHTTVMHGLTTLNNEMDTNESILREVQLIQYKLS